MAAPKVFVSSTCYDLKQMRQDIEGFITSYGYDAILSEKHSVTYNIKDTLEDDCYNELSLSDMLIGIIGGRYGSESLDNSGNSVSMNEMLKAIELNKQAYIFIDRHVHTEYYTYIRNVGKEIEYAYVDNIKIFDFISQLKSKTNIVINDFSTASDITDCLRSQWAGLFQTFLYNKEQQRQNEGLLTIKSVIEQLVSTSEKLSKSADDAAQNSNSFFPLSELTKQTISQSLIEISRELIGDNSGLLFFRKRDEMELFITNVLCFNEDLFSLGEYYKDNLALYVDFEFIFSGDNENRLIYRTMKDIKEYEEKNSKKFIFITRDAPDECVLDEDLPF